jgi:hypothetical protein
MRIKLKTFAFVIIATIFSKAPLQAAEPSFEKARVMLFNNPGGGVPVHYGLYIGFFEQLEGSYQPTRHRFWDVGLNAHVGVNPPSSNPWESYTMAMGHAVLPPAELDAHGDRVLSVAESLKDLRIAAGPANNNTPPVEWVDGYDNPEIPGAGEANGSPMTSSGELDLNEFISVRDDAWLTLVYELTAFKLGLNYNYSQWDGIDVLTADGIKAWNQRDIDPAKLAVGEAAYFITAAISGGASVSAFRAAVLAATAAGATLTEAQIVAAAQTLKPYLQQLAADKAAALTAKHYTDVQAQMAPEVSQAILNQYAGDTAGDAQAIQSFLTAHKDENFPALFTTMDAQADQIISNQNSYAVKKVLAKQLMTMLDQMRKGLLNEGSYLSPRFRRDMFQVVVDTAQAPVVSFHDTAQASGQTLSNLSGAPFWIKAQDGSGIGDVVVYQAGQQLLPQSGCNCTPQQDIRGPYVPQGLGNIAVDVRDSAANLVSVTKNVVPAPTPVPTPTPDLVPPQVTGLSYQQSGGQLIFTGSASDAGVGLKYAAYLAVMSDNSLKMVNNGVDFTQGAAAEAFSHSLNAGLIPCSAVKIRCQYFDMNNNKLDVDIPVSALQLCAETVTATWQPPAATATLTKSPTETPYPTPGTVQIAITSAGPANNFFGQPGYQIVAALTPSLQSYEIRITAIGISVGGSPLEVRLGQGYGTSYGDVFTPSNFMLMLDMTQFRVDVYDNMSRIIGTKTQAASYHVPNPAYPTSTPPPPPPPTNTPIYSPTPEIVQSTTVAGSGTCYDSAPNFSQLDYTDRIGLATTFSIPASGKYTFWSKPFLCYYLQFNVPAAGGGYTVDYRSANLYNWALVDKVNYSIINQGTVGMVGGPGVQCDGITAQTPVTIYIPEAGFSSTRYKVAIWRQNCADKYGSTNNASVEFRQIQSSPTPTDTKSNTPVVVPTSTWTPSKTFTPTSTGTPRCGNELNVALSAIGAQSPLPAINDGQVFTVAIQVSQVPFVLPEIDFGQKKIITDSRVAYLKGGADKAYFTDYEIQYQDDGGNWQTAKHVIQAAFMAPMFQGSVRCDLDGQFISAIFAQRWRITVNALSGGTVADVTEWGLFECGAAAATWTPSVTPTPDYTWTSSYTRTNILTPSKTFTSSDTFTITLTPTITPTSTVTPTSMFLSPLNLASPINGGASSTGTLVDGDLINFAQIMPGIGSFSDVVTTVPSALVNGIEIYTRSTISAGADAWMTSYELQTETSPGTWTSVFMVNNIEASLYLTSPAHIHKEFRQFEPQSGTKWRIKINGLHNQSYQMVLLEIRLLGGFEPTATITPTFTPDCFSSGGIAYQNDFEAPFVPADWNIPAGGTWMPSFQDFGSKSFALLPSGSGTYGLINKRADTQSLANAVIGARMAGVKSKASLALRVTGTAQANGSCSSCYMLTVDGTLATMSLYRVSASISTLMAGPVSAAGINAGDYHMKLQVQESAGVAALKGFINGVLAVQASDANPLPGGGFGMQAVGQYLLVDDLLVMRDVSCATPAPTPSWTRTPTPVPYALCQNWQVEALGPPAAWDVSDQSNGGGSAVVGAEGTEGNVALKLTAPGGKWICAQPSAPAAMMLHDVDLKVDVASPGRAAIYARASGTLANGYPTNAYIFQVIPNLDNEAQIYKVGSFGWAVIGTRTRFNNSNGRFTMRLVVQGNQVSAEAYDNAGNSVVLGPFTDSSFSAGTFGVQMYGGTASFDNFNVNAGSACAPPPASATPTWTHTATPSVTRTLTVTQSDTPTSTWTVSATETPSATMTPSITPTLTPDCAVLLYAYTEDWETGPGLLSGWSKVSQSGSGTFNVTGPSNKVAVLYPAGLWQGMVYNLLPTAGDLDFSARVNGNRGILLARVTGTLNAQGFPVNGYSFQVIPNVANEARLAKYVNNTWTLLGQASTSGMNTGDYRLRLEIVGNTLKGYVDGSSTPLVTATDATFSNGKFGMMAYNTTTYDELRLNPVSQCVATATPGGPGLAGVRGPGPGVKDAQARWLPADKVLVAAPNPAKDHCLLIWRQEFAGGARLRLYNLIGEPVSVIDAGWGPAGERSQEALLGSLASGIYLVSLETDEGMGWRARALSKLAVVR